MANEVEDLATEITEDQDVKTSAITLLTGLKGMLDAALAAPDPALRAAVKDLSNKLSTNTDGLAAAIVANTPAA